MITAPRRSPLGAIQKRVALQSHVAEASLILYENLLPYFKGEKSEIWEILDLMYFNRFEDIYSSFRFSDDNVHSGKKIISGR